MEPIPDTIDGLLKLLTNIVNACDGCTYCCSAPAIEKDQREPGEDPALFEKPSGVMCSQCVNNQCAIYQNRPKVCQEYRCLYSVGVLSHRPDDTRIAWSIQPQYHPVHGPPVMTGKLVVTGHTEEDAVEVMKDPRNQEDVMELFNSGVFEGVYVRGPVNCLMFFDAKTEPNLPPELKEQGVVCVMVDIDREDFMKVAIDKSTQRLAPFELGCELRS